LNIHWLFLVGDEIETENQIVKNRSPRCRITNNQNSITAVFMINLSASQANDGEIDETHNKIHFAGVSFTPVSYFIKCPK
jgi:hypothetical protein